MGKGTGRGNSAGVKAWRKSERWRRIALAQALANVRAWAKRPRCGATAKRSGCPCQQPALFNGRCRWHGGATPSGKNWHQPVFSDGTTASGTSKLDRKLYDLAQARKRREKALKTMTAEQRAAHAKWHEARDPRLSVRLSRRQAKRQAVAARAIFDTPGAPPTPEIMMLEEKIRLLTLEADQLASSSVAMERKPDAVDIFG
jgi:hypothetical protein